MNDAKGLTWEVNEPSKHVDFMDLSISIDNGKIATTLFENRATAIFTSLRTRAILRGRSPESYTE